MRSVHELEYNTHPHLIRVATCGKVDFIDLNTLVRIEAWSNYSKLILSSGKRLVVAKVLKRFEEGLDNSMFLRVHSTHLINLHFLEGISDHGELCLLNGDRIPVSRRRKRTIKSVIKESIG